MLVALAAALLGSLVAARFLPARPAAGAQLIEDVGLVEDAGLEPALGLGAIEVA